MKISKTHGNDFLHERLKEVDPESAKAIHPNNVKKVIRALEYYKETGQGYQTIIRNKTKESPYNFAYFVLNDDRKNL